MEGTGCGVPLRIPVSDIPEARERAHCPGRETEAKLRNVELCGSKADELRTGI